MRVSESEIDEVRRSFLVYFSTHAKFSCRTSRGIQDKLYPAMFCKDIEDRFTSWQLKTALKYGILTKEKIKIENSVRAVYCCIGARLRQQKAHKRLIEKFFNLFRIKKEGL